ncbi:MAG TPA: hypothetical protein PJ986_04620 [Gammaproteobacteria bacterium]|nr:hypothetical protein [Gammaproteobacteria bacterium]
MSAEAKQLTNAEIGQLALAARDAGALPKLSAAEVPNRATFEAVQKQERQAAALHPAVPLVDVRRYSRYMEVPPGKLAAEEQEYSREFASLGIDPQTANHIVNRVMWNATANASKRERYAQQEWTEHAMGQMTDGAWARTRGDVSAWLSKNAPKVLAMLDKSGASNDSDALREIYEAYKSARGRGRA